MSSDEDDEKDRRKSRGDTDKPTRDSRGRWLKDYCPNPKGRPTKKPKKIIHESDLQVFANTLVNVTAIGQKERMTRHTALLNRMFESAMRGSVSQQRFLYKEFENSDKRLAALRVRYERLMLDWYINNPEHLEMPLEVEMEIEALRSLLNCYYIHDYLGEGGSQTDDDDDDDG